MTTLHPVSLSGLSGLSQAHHAKHRPIYAIANEIRQLWPTPYFGAKPYLQAMRSLSTIRDKYGEDSASSIVNYFLANAQTWRGEDARRIKAELNAMLK